MNKKLQTTLSLLYKIKSAGSISGLALAASNYQHQQSVKKHYGRETFPSNQEIERQKQEAGTFPSTLRFSLLVPLYNTPKQYLREMLISVFNQTCPNWELCLADGSDQEHNQLKAGIDEVAKECHIAPEKIKYRRLDHNGGISANTNACIELATGNYLVPFDHDDYLHPEVLYRYAKIILEENADYLYCDEATFQNDNLDDIITLHFKPDYAIDNLRANNYICHLSCFKRSLIDSIPQIRYRSEFDGSQDHDLILRVTARARKIVHVPKVLYYWRAHEGSTASALEEKDYAIHAARGAVAADLEAAGYHGCKVESSRAAQNIFRIWYPLNGSPKIALIMPDEGKRWAEKIRNTLQYPYLTIQCYASITDARAAAINEAVKAAEGEYLLFLGAGVIPQDKDSLKELLMYAQRSDVGAVGGLIKAHRRIESAGLILGVGKDHIAAPFYRGWPTSGVGYMGRLCYAQDLSAVSINCMMIRRTNFEKVGGFDEAYSKKRYDIDLCLRLREKHLWNIMNPYAAFIDTRKHWAKDESQNSDDQRLQTKWRGQYMQGDPFYNCNFISDNGIITFNCNS